MKAGVFNFGTTRVGVRATLTPSERLCYFAAMVASLTGFAKQRIPLLVASLLLLIAACRGSSKQTLQNPGVAAEESAYKSKIEVSKVGLAKGENYLGSHVFYVEGTLKNAGDRVVQRVEITFLFRDSLKQVVLKESRKALDYKAGGGLDADKSTRFQVAFDHLPKDWNYILPELEVSQVSLKNLKE